MKNQAATLKHLQNLNYNASNFNGIKKVTVNAKNRAYTASLDSDYMIIDADTYSDELASAIRWYRCDVMLISCCMITKKISSKNGLNLYKYTYLYGQELVELGEFYVNCRNPKTFIKHLNEDTLNAKAKDLGISSELFIDIMNEVRL